jgi:hypothetical protein
MSDLLAFLQLGFRHIVSLAAADHLLFLLALAASYRFRDWRAVVWTVSAFTVGHSVTLALAVTNVLVLPGDVIELLIPVTIVATAIGNLSALRLPPRAAVKPMFLLVGLFGLIHGAGFANYLRELFLESIAVPLLGFNAGIELGQLVVLGAIWAVLTLIDRVAERLPQSSRWTPYRMRVIAVSLVVGVVSSGWAAERFPW